MGIVVEPEEINKNKYFKYNFFSFLQNVLNYSFYLIAGKKIELPWKFLIVSIKWKSRRNYSNNKKRRISTTANVFTGFAIKMKPLKKNATDSFICPLLSFFARGWKQRAKVAGSSSSITRSSWLPCCPRTPSTRHCTAASPPSLRKRWRTRTTLWSYSVSSPPHIIHVHDQKSMFFCHGVWCRLAKWFKYSESHTWRCAK